MERLWPDVAIPPGEHLADTLRELRISQSELARRMGRPQQAINEIVRGRKEITPETAIQLERVTGVPGHIWVRLEADYQYNRARLAHLEWQRSIEAQVAAVFGETQRESSAARETLKDAETIAQDAVDSFRELAKALGVGDQTDAHDEAPRVADSSSAGRVAAGKARRRRARR